MHDKYIKVLSVKITGIKVVFCIDMGFYNGTTYHQCNEYSDEVKKIILVVSNFIPWTKNKMLSLS